METKVPPETARHLVLFLQTANVSELAAMEQAIFCLKQGQRTSQATSRTYRDAAYEQIAEAFPPATDRVRELLARDGR
jgi:hypothetical protein